MMDEVAGNGGTIDIQKHLQPELGVPVVPISACQERGCCRTGGLWPCARSRTANAPSTMDFCTGEVHRAIHSHGAHDRGPCRAQKEIPLRFAATKLVEGDEPMMDKLEINQTMSGRLSSMWQTRWRPPSAPTGRLPWRICGTATSSRSAPDAVHKPGDTAEQLRSVQIDAHSHPQGTWPSRSSWASCCWCSGSPSAWWVPPSVTCLPRASAW